MEPQGYPINDPDDRHALMINSDTCTLYELFDARCDTALIQQVFVNLLSNALKYTRRRARPVVEIGATTTAAGERVVFVRDNGVGFDMAYGEKLFRPFERLHRQTEFPGTGVGLTTVQRVVRRHGGTVWAEAHVDHGAAFYFTLNDRRAP